jgi:multiple antibiotic resistance protein
VLILFAATGKLIFRLLGIGMAAFQMAGSLILLLVALDMLRARRGPVRETAAETDAGVAKADIAVTPLAIPMLAGPGAISSVILLEQKARGFNQTAAVYATVVAVLLISFLILHLSAHGARWLKPLAMTVITRIMGLLLAAIAFQFLLDALRAEGLFGR